MIDIYAPFAGAAQLRVEPGDIVDTGEVLVVVEAVKLEAPVLAPAPARVESIAVADNATVAGGDVLLSLAPLPGETV